MKLAIVGDVHANYESLCKVERLIKSEAFDLVVFVGDLLTYGPEPEKTLRKIISLSESFPVRICLGNHDQMYRDLFAGESEYLSRLPEWIQESVNWTLDKIDQALWSSINFKQSVEVDCLYISHANPFGPGNWTYINTESDHLEAIEYLKTKGFRLGVFGHTHREKSYISNIGSFAPLGSERIKLQRGEAAIVNAGSIGQPRGMLDTSILVVDIDGEQLYINRRYFQYNLEKHLAELEASSLSKLTVDKLVSFYN